MTMKKAQDGKFMKEYHVFHSILHHYQDSEESWMPPVNTSPLKTLSVYILSYSDLECNMNNASCMKTSMKMMFLVNFCPQFFYFPRSKFQISITQANIASKKNIVLCVIDIRKEPGSLFFSYFYFLCKLRILTSPVSVEIFKFFVTMA